MKLPQISSRTMTPMVLAALILVVSLVTMLLEKVVESAKLIENDPERTWTIATAFLMFFSIFVSIFLLRTENKIKGFWNQSMISFMGLAMANAFLATSLSGKAIADAGSFKFLYLVVTIGFLVFISIVNIARKIVNFAEREEWNEPRMKSRKRR
jgi:hypothetical protein